MDTGSTLEKLPVELRQKLLSAAPDILSLRSMVLSCPSLYHAFLGAEGVVTTEVMRRQFASFPEVFVQQAMHHPTFGIPVGDMNSILKNKNKLQAPVPAEFWTLAKALPLGKLQPVVERFTSDFIAETLSESSAFSCIDPAPNWPASRDELIRIQRALYRFELFRPPFVFFYYSDDRVLFCNKCQMFCDRCQMFSPLEIEQFTILYEYLYRLVFPGTRSARICQQGTNFLTAFNEILQHDFEWGGYSVCPADAVPYRYTDRVNNLPLGCILWRGLEFVRRVADAETYEARRDLLGSLWPKFGKRCSPEVLRDWLYWHDDSIGPEEYTGDTEQDFIPTYPMLPPDPNSGPADAWRWGNQDESVEPSCDSVKLVALRSRGYCMWDRARLDKWTVFQQPRDLLNNPHLKKGGHSGWIHTLETRAEKARNGQT